MTGEAAGAAPAAPLALRVVHPCQLIAHGDAERVEVLRSPVVRETDPLYEPVARFIADHGLVLAARESFPDGEWMWAEVEVSVYVPPAVRNGVLAGTELSVPWHTPAALSVSQ